MAKNTTEEIDKLFQKLSLAPELRDEPEKGKYPKGRIKQVFDVFGAEMNNLMRVNIWFLLFAVPFFALLFWYAPYVKAQAIANFNFMGNIGIGYPGGSDAAVQGMIAVYTAYQKVLYLSVPCFLVLSLGVCGSLNCYKKFIWGEKVSVTKDFFRGVKKHWWKYLLVMLFDALVVLGAGSTLLYFLKLKQLGTLMAWHWVMVIGVFLVAYLLMYVNMTLLPTLCTLDLGFSGCVKNSLIFSVKLFVIGIILWTVSLLPVLFLFNTSSFVSVMLYMMMIMFGFTLYGLAYTSFAQLGIDNMLTPLYKLSITPDAPKKKDKTKAQIARPNYKKGGKK
jgi:hypothetical protein